MLQRVLNQFNKITLRYGKVDYDAEFFSEKWHREWHQLKFIVHALLKTHPQCQTILDFGCGPGILIDYMNDQNFNYHGFDNSPQAKEIYLQQFGKYPHKFYSDLCQATKGQYDLFFSFDVFEHIPLKNIAEILAQCQHIPHYLLNINRYRWLPGHINIRSDSSWIKALSKMGLSYDLEATQAIRQKYLELKPSAEDLWQENLFIFHRD